MKTPKITMATLGIAVEPDELFDLLNHLDEVLLPIERITKQEQGEFYKDFVPTDAEDEEDTWQGHTITYKIDDTNIFFAMSYPSGHSYLVRVDKNFIQTR